MKNIFLKIVLVLFLVFGNYFFLNAQTNSCPAIAPFLCNNGSCTNEAVNCNESWGRGVNTTNNPATPTDTPLATSGGVNVSSNSCTGNLRYDKAAAEACARLAEQQGRAAGYDITCSAPARTEFIIKNANPVGDRNTYIGDCTINGISGFSPESLAGYRGTGQCVTVDDAFLGTSCVYGSNFNINPMWSSLPCDLANAVSGQTGALSGASTCTQGARNFFGTNSPATWRASNQTMRRQLQPGRTAINNINLLNRGGQNIFGNSNQTQNSSTKDNTRDGWYYKDPYRSTIEGEKDFNLDDNNCTGTEINPECHPEWSVKESPCLTSTVGACSSERVNPYFAVSFAKKAESIAREKGYRASCQAKYISARPRIDPITLLNYYYEITCTINGSTVVKAEDIVNNSSDWENKVKENSRSSNRRSGTSSGSIDGGGGLKINNNTSNTSNNKFLPCALTATCAINVVNTRALSCFPKTQTVKGLNSVWTWIANYGDKTFTATYNWEAQGSTKVFGSGRNFGTSYSTPGTYNVSVTTEGQTDSCQITVTE